MNDELIKKLKYLRLTGVLANWEGYLKLAAKKNWSHGRLLTHIVEEEYRIKQENAREFRLKRASIPERYAIETFPFKKQPKLNKKKVLALYDGFEYIKRKQNIILLGPTGCGKTGIATCFLIHAINRGYTGRHVMFAELIGDLFRSAADHSEEKVIKKYFSYDCLLIDEIGYVEAAGPQQVGLFFTLMHKRHKRKTTLITSNLGFSEWGSFLKNEHLTAALIDRLTEVSHVINMKNCRSIRPTLEKK